MTRAARCPNGHRTSVPDDSRFCESCGAELAHLCSRGHENSPGVSFCTTCGLPLDSAAGPVDAPAPGVVAAPGPWFRSPVFAVVVALVVLGGGGGGLAAALSQRSPRIVVAHTPPATATPVTSATVPVVTTPPPTVAPDTTTTAIEQTAEMTSDYPDDPSKCGPEPTDHSAPYSASHTYEVTATIHLWSGPSTSSTPLAVIESTDYGPGGIGCPSGNGPMATVQCKTTGQAITGPFGTDPTWEQVSWNGMVGFVPDEWLDTKWDVANFSQC